MRTDIKENKFFKIYINVTNIGDRDGSETILGFISAPNAGKNNSPISSLI